MTTTLTHPDAEDLGRFVEGTLEEPERAAVVEHLADCDDCRILVVDASEFFAKEHPVDLVDDRGVVAQSNGSARWWMAAAAAVAIAVGGLWLVDARQDRLSPVKEASSKLPSRLMAGRLNDFDYAAPKKSLRGGNEESDPGLNQVEVVANEVLQRSGDSAKMQHAKGVAGLLLVEAELAGRDSNDNDTSDLTNLRNDRDTAINMLQSAATKVPDNAVYWSDLAAALMAKGDFTHALDACNQALKIDQRSPDALFNRAKALDLMAQNPAQPTDAINAAINAYKAYLDVDPTSPWANEARDRMKYLSDELKPLP